MGRSAPDFPRPFVVLGRLGTLQRTAVPQSAGRHASAVHGLAEEADLNVVVPQRLQYRSDGRVGPRAIVGIRRSQPVKRPGEAHPVSEIGIPVLMFG